MRIVLISLVYESILSDMVFKFPSEYNSIFLRLELYSGFSSIFLTKSFTLTGCQEPFLRTDTVFSELIIFFIKSTLDISDGIVSFAIRTSPFSSLKYIAFNSSRSRNLCSSKAVIPSVSSSLFYHNLMSKDYTNLFCCLKHHKHNRSQTATHENLRETNSYTQLQPADNWSCNSYFVRD